MLVCLVVCSLPGTRPLDSGGFPGSFITISSVLNREELLIPTNHVHCRGSVCSNPTTRIHKASAKYTCLNRVVVSEIHSRP